MIKSGDAILRTNSDEKYVLDIMAEVLNEKYEWQKRFDTLLGDPGKNGNRRKLPVDAYFPRSNLIIEYWEKQHFKPVDIMDKRITISGVSRGQQRKIYDLRKEKWALDNNVRVIIITYLQLKHKPNGRLLRDKIEDRKVIENILKVDLGRMGED